MSVGGEEAGAGGGVVLGAIPLIVARVATTERRTWTWPRFTVPRIVDYLIVAIFMFFVF